MLSFVLLDLFLMNFALPHDRSHSVTVVKMPAFSILQLMPSRSTALGLVLKIWSSVLIDDCHYLQDSIKKYLLDEVNCVNRKRVWL